MERFFTERVARYWDRLPRAVISALSLLEFKKHVDNALRHRVRFLAVPLWSQELDSLIFVDSFRFRIFYSYIL